jgi:S-DNA-T family DNA segregation ATPase FtsK/SpoIIIE
MSKAKTVSPARTRSDSSAPRVRHPERPPLNPQLYRDIAAIALAALGVVLLLGLSREKLVGPLGSWLLMLTRLFLGTGVYLAPLLCMAAALAIVRGSASPRGRSAGIGAIGLLLVFLGWLHVLAWGAGDLFQTSGARWRWLLGARDAQVLAGRADGGLVGGLVASVLSPLGIAGSYVALAAAGISALLILTETTLAAVGRRMREESRRAAQLARARSTPPLPAEATIVPPVRSRRGVFLDLEDDALDAPDGARRRSRATVADEADGPLPPAEKERLSCNFPLSAIGSGRTVRCQPSAPEAEDPLSEPDEPRRPGLPKWLPGLRDALQWKREVTDPALLPSPRPAMPDKAARPETSAGAPAREADGPLPAVTPPVRERRDPEPPSLREAAPRPVWREVPVTRGQEATYRADRNRSDEYTLPSSELLDPPAPASPRHASAEADANIAILESTLRDFNIEAQVVEIADGPTITRYEIRLAPGIRVKKILDLADNIAMSLEALSVRVEAPIPGKSAIGIEVPKKATRLVTLRECVETRAFMEHSSRVAFMLGTDVAGNVQFADLVKMPHLLIAGATNSGKSACLNGIISSMLFRARPDEVKFILIDPKRVELTLYDGIPHLIHPVVKDVKLAAGLLRWVLKEMERRYDLFTEALTRNIDGYNSKVADDPDRRLPYIVVVIDELADLMMLQGAEVEQAICRLAQLARATGIHLIIATQRPSVDVITGLIKANVPSRIAFSVTSQIDSRTILDCKGAENLIGRGDMLFKPVEAAKPIRLQGAWVSETEVVNVVEFLKTQGRPEYIAQAISADTLAATRGGGNAIEEDEEDDLFEPAARFLVSTGHASTSMIQRKFKIGYTRAARLVDMMEAKGIVGPLDGAKPREILMGPASLDAFFHGSREAFLAPLGIGSEAPEEDAPLSLPEEDEEPFAP